MFSSIVKKIFGTANNRALKKYRAKVAAINALEPAMKKLSDKKMREKTAEFKERLANGETLDKILPEAFALVREAAIRTIGQRHYDVQMIGGMILHDGKITEMKTGEGKTLVATLPMYLNALSGKGVHVVTVNDYLASRDAEWMGKIHRFLGLTVGCITGELDDDERREQYACDITYGTNHEFGFDYLRDNMKFRLDRLVQRPFSYAIVDEVDSILIDEARTPLIISGPADDSSDLYRLVDDAVLKLEKKHYKVDEKDRNATLTEEGMEFMENLLFDRGITKVKNLYDISNAQVIHHVDKALTAHTLYKSDVDYLVKDDEVFIIDEFNGRIMDGRRYSDGLHQALEAKEHVEIKRESQTLASITYQNYFRLYPKLAGMTGTALTEAQEFEEIYKLKCIEVPTNLPVARTDFEDEIYLDEESKYDAIVALIKELHKKNQPVLVGTISIEKSEKLADRLKREGIKSFSVLNAKHHEQEAYIVAEAGVPGAITIATNMAGRGTDIQLGGGLDMRVEKETSGIDDAELLKKKIDEIKADIAEKKKEALNAGGLFVIGTERHESRRIDNQLRGRTGRQGDPGASRFYLSMDDDLMRIFGGEKMKSMLARFGLKPGEAITHKWVSRALEKAQMKVEARNFGIRKNLLKYDDVMNEQRKMVYAQRRSLMEKESVSSVVDDMRSDTIEFLVASHIPVRSLPEDWNASGLETATHEHLGIDAPVAKWSAESPNIDEQSVFERIEKLADERMAARRKHYGKEFMDKIEKSVMLQTLDSIWKENLLQLDYLKKGIGLRAYGQKDPLNEYKKESFFIFEENMDRIKRTTTRTLMLADFTPEGVDKLTEEDDMDYEESDATEPVFDESIPRNAPCPCGSGKKYKHCHGKL
ncbi:MAG: preprotein translocase subunit SecA [Rickettsiales bacterium]|jgi:preprotein translocase subunit SecA|nr:preprotein translocase subunit SecA [Rickettsiales bacterium]